MLNKLQKVLALKEFRRSIALKFNVPELRDDHLISLAKTLMESAKYDGSREEQYLHLSKVLISNSNEGIDIDAFKKKMRLQGGPIGRLLLAAGIAEPLYDLRFSNLEDDEITFAADMLNSSIVALVEEIVPEKIRDYAATARNSVALLDKGQQQLI